MLFHCWWWQPGGVYSLVPTEHVSNLLGIFLSQQSSGQLAGQSNLPG